MQKIVGGGGGTVGLRVADLPLVQQLIESVDQGIVTASANFTGEPAPVKRSEIDSELVEKVDGVVGGEAGGQMASTVVDASVLPVKVLRSGPVRLDVAD